MTAVEAPRSAPVTVAPGRGLLVDGELQPLVSGAVHYWRHARADWGRVLDAVGQLGLPLVETYVPWSVHEVAAGEYDFTGNRDLAAFAAEVAACGLRLVLRPGPHINAELADFGFPSRVLWDPRCQAHGPLGTPVIQHSRSGYFPCPSYSSPAFLAEVDRWYDEVVPRIAALQHPDGPVIAVQVDNEMGYFFFVEPFVMDYRPEAVADWRAWSGRTGDPPTDGTQDPDLVDSWVRHKEVSRAAALARLASGLRDRGIHLPLFHNDFPHLGSPLDQAVLEANGTVDIAANDLYLMREDLADGMRAARTLAAASQLPYIAELGAGWVADLVGIPQRIDPLDEELAILALLLTGVRAWNWYMLAEREHWYGSPIDVTGRIRPGEAELYPRLIAMLRRLDWWELTRDAPVLLLVDRDEERRQAGRRTACEVNAVLDPLQLPAALRVLEPDRQAPLLAAWRERLEAAGLDFDEGSSDAPPDPERYQVILRAHSPDARDGTETPVLPTARYPLGAPPGVSLHRFTGRGREVLGLLNRGERPATVRVAGLGPAVLAGAWHAERHTVTGELLLDVPGHYAQLWEVTR